MYEWTKGWFSSTNADESKSQTPSVFGFLSDLSERTFPYGSIVFERLGLNEWVEIDHVILSILLLWFTAKLCFAIIRSYGTYKVIISQLVCVLSIAFICLSFMRLLISKQNGYSIFGGKLENPTMGSLAVALMVTEVSMDGIKHRRLIFDTIKKISGLSAVWILIWAIFISQPLDLQRQGFTPLLSVLPMTGILLAIYKHFSSAEEEPITAADTTDEENTSSEGDDGENVDEKCICHFLTWTPPKIGTILSRLFRWMGTLLSIRYMNIVISVGSLCAMVYCFWYITEEYKVFALLFIYVGFPILLTNAIKRNILSEDTARLLSETSYLGANVLYYILFREHVHVRSVKIKDYMEVFKDSKDRFPEILSNLFNTSISMSSSFVWIVCKFVQKCPHGIQKVVSLGVSWVTNFIVILYGSSTNLLCAILDYLGMELSVEIAILLACCVLFLIFFWKASSGNIQEIFLRMISGLSILFTAGCLIRFSIGLMEGNSLFHEKMRIPFLGIVGVGLMVLEAIINGIKKEIYGYGVSDLPADDRCALVLDSVRTFIRHGKVIIFAWATFISLPSDQKTSEYTSLLSLFPLIELIKAMNDYFAPEVEEPTMTGDAIDRNVLGLDWKCLFYGAISLGSIITLTYLFFYLTQDNHVYALPLVDKGIPILITKAKGRQSLTDNNGHLISEAVCLSGSLLYYYLFREHIKVGQRTGSGSAAKNGADAGQGHEIPFITSPSSLEDSLNIKIPESGSCTIMKKDGKWMCKEEDDAKQVVSETGKCTLVQKDNKWVCKEGGDFPIKIEDILPKLNFPEKEACILMKRGGEWMCKEEEEVLTNTKLGKVNPSKFLEWAEFDAPDGGTCIPMRKGGTWKCKEETDSKNERTEPPPSDESGWIPILRDTGSVAGPLGLLMSIWMMINNRDINIYYDVL